MERKTVLVTGASGALGSLLCNEVADDGLEVIVSSRSAGVKMDLSDLDDVFSTVTSVRPDAIVHLAAMTGAVCDDDPAQAWAINVEATRTIAAAAVEVGVDRIVFASSAAVYGDAGTRPFVESDTLLGASTYARTKIAAEDALSSTVHGTNTAALSLRIFNCWGPGFVHALPMRLVDERKGSAIRLAGLDTFVRDYVHARDVAEIITHVLTGPGSDAPDVINVASGVGTSNRQLVAGLGSIEGDDFVVVDPVDSHSVGDAGLLKTWFGYEARRRPTRDHPELFG